MQSKDSKQITVNGKQNMKILILGEIIGRPGRTKVKEILPSLLSEHSPDFIISNGEHLAGGKGLTPEKVLEMKEEAGIDFFTTGNHVFALHEITPALEDSHFPVVRPANYPPGVPGKEYKTVKIKSKKILIVNLSGRVFVQSSLDDPFRKIDEILKKEKTPFVIVDIHAEATSEKILMSDYLDGRVSILFGTHTHIPTSDFQILPKGTFYVTDIGMIGPVNSVIGLKKEVSRDRILRQMPAKYEVAPFGPTYFNAFLVELDSRGRAKNFQKIEKII